MGVWGRSCSGLLLAELELVPFNTGVDSGSVRLVEMTWNEELKHKIEFSIVINLF